MNVLVTGGNGYIAKSIARYCNTQFNLDIVTRAECNLEDRKSVDLFMQNKEYDCVIHTAIAGGSRLKDDESSVVFKNVSMVQNLLRHKNKFNRFINIGSGASIWMPDTPYGMSKQIIEKYVGELDEGFTLNVYGVFDEYELDTRFIKANIKRYIKKEPLSIHCNKYMSFFYMKDFINLLQQYVALDVNHLSKVIDCCYDKTYSLHEIASDMINKLSDYSVPILETKNDEVEYYCGIKVPRSVAPANFIGIHKGIIETYKALLETQLKTE